ncbi:integral membrane protein (plasmid) [Streptomyces alboflavus]|uniref:Integral membrane protein n=1 Tax=Streptomyces alboflavus TaxID=67267 RepID=A0A291W4Q8_9ACTN|nr:MFS transporter [Streptomyces alboflavus]ATM24569.1 integral membrane protein [Streptomyces alboflavus]
MSATTVPAPALKGPEPPSAHRPWPPVIWALLSITLVARSFGFAYPFLSYHLKELGFTTQAVGQALAVFGIGWLIGQMLTGWATDRFGRRRTLVASMATAAVCLPLLAQAHAFAAVCAGALIAGIVYDAARPVVSAVIADVITDDEQRAAVNGWRHGAVNIGAAITGVAGGLLAGRAGFEALFWLNAAACAACALVARHYLEADSPAGSAPSTARGSVRAALHDGRLWLLWAASTAALTCLSGMFTALPLMMDADGLGADAYGWSQAANAGAVIVLTPLLTPRLSRRCGHQRPMVGMLACSALLLGLGMGSAGLADTTLGYSLAVAAAVPGEIVLFIAASDVLNKISPAPSRGLYAGIWGSSLAASVVIAPVLAAASLTAGGDGLAALTTLATGVLGAVLCLPLFGLTSRPAPAAVRHPAPAAP